MEVRTRGRWSGKEKEERSEGRLGGGVEGNVCRDVVRKEGYDSLNVSHQPESKRHHSALP